MKEYELSVVFHPDLEMNLDPALDKVKKLVETSGGKIVKEEPEGKKRLAYPIRKLDYGLYYYMNAELPSQAPGKISTNLGISDEVIRFMVVKADPKRAKYAAIKAAAEQAESAEETTNKEEEA